MEQKESQSQQYELSRLKAENDKLKAENKELRERNEQLLSLVARRGQDLRNELQERDQKTRVSFMGEFIKKDIEEDNFNKRSKKR